MGALDNAKPWPVQVHSIGGCLVDFGFDHNGGVKTSQTVIAVHILALKAAVLLMYALALLELIAFPIPSEASTVEILRARMEGGRVKGWPAAVFGHLAMFCFFLIPLVWIIFPGVTEYLVMTTHALAPLRNWTAAVLILWGSGFTLYAVLDLRRFRAEHAAENILKQDGAYRISRNPQVLGNHIAGAGILCAFPGLVMFLLFGGYFIHMHRKIAIEEDHLHRKLGRPYAQYRLRTGRYLRLGVPSKRTFTEPPAT